MSEKKSSTNEEVIPKKTKVLGEEALTSLTTIIAGIPQPTPGKINIEEDGSSTSSQNQPIITENQS